MRLRRRSGRYDAGSRTAPSGPSTAKPPAGTGTGDVGDPEEAWRVLATEALPDWLPVERQSRRARRVARGPPSWAR